MSTRRESMVRRVRIASICAVALVAAAGGVYADTGGKEVTCDQVLAAMEKAGGSKSPDQVAADLGVGIKRLRSCMNEVEGGKYPVPQPDPPAPAAEDGAGD
jgi:hypothetical protein